MDTRDSALGARWVASLSLVAWIVAGVGWAAPQQMARREGAAQRAPVGSSLTAVMGFAWTAASEPIPDATVRLRNVLSGRVEAVARTSSRGEFVFTDLEGGTYVIELEDASGRVVAVGRPFSVAPGETVATFVRLLGEHTPWFARLFSNAASAAVSSAAGLGLTAVAPSEQSISPIR